ncbi:hypothetical protein R3I94_018203 [Phoxinus phoxinus]
MTAVKSFEAALTSQTSEDIPRFSSHAFLRTELSEEERQSLRVRPMEQRAAFSMCTRSANRSGSLLMTRRSGSGLFPLRRKRDAQKIQKLNAKVTRRSLNRSSSSFYCNRSEFPHECKRNPASRAE